MRGPRLRRTVCRTWTNTSQGRGVCSGGQGSGAGTRGFHEDEGGDTSIVHNLITDWQWAYGDALRLLGEPRRNRCGLGRTEWSETDPGQGNGTSGSRDSPFGRLRADPLGDFGVKALRNFGAPSHVFTLLGQCVQFLAECVHFLARCVQFGGPCVQFLAMRVHVGSAGREAEDSSLRPGWERQSKPLQDYGQRPSSP